MDYHSVVFHPQGPTLFELLGQALSSTREGYNKLAPKFDHTPFRTPDKVIEQTLAVLSDRPKQTLDLCTGTGAALPFLMRCTRERVVGVDFSPGMLAIARQRVDSLKQRLEASPDVEFIETDIFSLREIQAFDLVTCFGAFGHVPDEAGPRFVDMIRQSLRPGGRFLFVTAERPPLYSPRALISRGFNGAMRLRNAMFSPPFVMYYLTFMLPDIQRLLSWRGFSTTLHRERFEPPYNQLVIVEAIRT